MKTIKTTILLLLFLFIGINTQAQFWKKVTKSAEKAAERAVLKKTEQKATEKTDKALDNLFDMDLSTMGMGGRQVDPSTLPSSYEFKWRYTLQMSHSKGDIKMHYVLSENGGAFGSKPEMSQGRTPMGNMLMIMDPTLSTTTILMDNGGKKTGTVMSNPDITGAVSKESNMEDYDFKEIGTKQILGFTCQGFQIENEDALTTMYVAFDTPVSFDNMYSGNNAKQLPKGFDPKWLERIGDNSLMMEIDFKNKRKPKQSAKMTCVALEKEPLHINVSEYDFSFQTSLQQQRN
ncbi:DUF4412 domain-containing protein [Kriegella aquimaris]|uniref:DUF4412 domain-containing protein n=1 Tax=Kriegella aquimaris TaxID=192904 RepID=A0A1G9WXI0_9FLAO|nr:DUF4412 domain-containing protein [Kriegella aquimaris]SDM89294.1 protein of unknown function [Kriegella aquimaris]